MKSLFVEIWKATKDFVESRRRVATTGCDLRCWLVFMLQEPERESGRPIVV